MVKLFYLINVINNVSVEKSTLRLFNVQNI